MGLGKDPRQQQLPPAELPQGFGGRATNLGGVWEIPSWGEMVTNRFVCHVAESGWWPEVELQGASLGW